MMVGALIRGIRNPGRNLARSVLVVLLLSVIIGIFGIMVQAASLTRQQLSQMEARVRTQIELREAGAFGTGGFGGDNPIGHEGFSVATLEKVRAIPHARYLVRVDEYVYTPQIDPSKPNAYAMIIGLRPAAELRAIGEVDYEHARLIAGRGLQAEDGDQPVAVIGRLYALQRVNLKPPLDDAILANTGILLNGTPFRVVGIYATGNDFGDNHVFVPLEVFRRTFQPGEKLSKIFVTVDSVQHVETVVEELKTIPEADVVIAPEAVSTAK